MSEEEISQAAERPLPTAVTHLADEHDGTAGTLAALALYALTHGTGLRLRVALAIWDAEKGQYMSWKGQSWKIEIPGPDHSEKALAIKGAMEDFFDAVARGGAAKVSDVLKRSV